jgi:hypothetical protein
MTAVRFIPVGVVALGQLATRAAAPQPLNEPSATANHSGHCLQTDSLQRNEFYQRPDDEVGSWLGTAHQLSNGFPNQGGIHLIHFKADPDIA